MKRLLVVSWAMPPMLYPRSIQVARILAVLSRRGWEITVVCNQPQEPGVSDASLSSLYDASYRKISVPPDNSRQVDVLMSPWHEPALQSARAELRASPYSLLVTFAQPWVDHVIGLELHRESRIPWIAHFSDPWVDNPYYASADPKQLREWKHLERDVIRQTAAVIFTNTQALDLVMGKYPSNWRRKAAVIPHAFDAELALSLRGERPAADHRLRMIYTGDLYAERSATGLFKALHALSQQGSLADRLTIQFMGRIMASELSLAEELGLSDIIVFHDQLPYMQSLQAIAASDVLLLIDAPSSKPGPFLPSKLVDYLMFGKPILGLVPRDGASAELLRKLGNDVVAPDDVPSIVRSIEGLLSQWQTGNLKPAAPFEDVASSYHPERVGLQWEQALSSASESVLTRSWWQSIWMR